MYVNPNLAQPQNAKTDKWPIKPIRTTNTTPNPRNAALVTSGFQPARFSLVSAHYHKRSYTVRRTTISISKDLVCLFVCRCTGSGGLWWTSPSRQVREAAIGNKAPWTGTKPRGQVSKPLITCYVLRSVTCKKWPHLDLWL